jgi:hypothetical protein
MKIPLKSLEHRLQLSWRAATQPVFISFSSVSCDGGDCLASDTGSHQDSAVDSRNQQWYPVERAVVRCSFEAEFVEDSGQIVEARFGLAEAFVEFDAHENQRDLDPLGVPAVAVSQVFGMCIHNRRASVNYTAGECGKLSKLISPTNPEHRLFVPSLCSPKTERLGPDISHKAAFRRRGTPTSPARPYGRCSGTSAQARVV